MGIAILHKINGLFLQYTLFMNHPSYVSANKELPEAKMHFYKQRLDSITSFFIFSLAEKNR